MAKWIIAIDAGGSKCRANLCTLSGDVVDTAQTGPSNLFSDFDNGMLQINKAVDQLLGKQYGDDKSVLASQCLLSIGAAGASIPSVQERFANWQPPFEKAMLHSDLAIACYAANEGKDCAFVVLGTGSSIAVFENGQLKQYGGHGFLLGDTASGAWLGMQAMRWYVSALESPSKQGADDINLMHAMSAKVGQNINTIVSQWGNAKASEFASLAPALIDIKDRSVNIKIWLEQACDYLCELLREHAPELPIFVGGGLAFLYQDAMQVNLNKTIYKPKSDAKHGAFLLAKNQHNIPTL